MTASIKLLHNCSFCGKSQTQVKTLVSGNGAFICNECVTLCQEVIKPNSSEQEQPKNNIPDLTPPQIVEFLDQHVIGQNLAKRTLAVAIYNHLKRIDNPIIDGVTIDKSNVLMIGSSGVGKSYMVSTLAKILKVPFAVVDATSLSQTGYVGLDPEECLVRLYQSAEQDVERAQRGIVFIDEIDKISRKSGENVSTTRDVSGEGVQQALLKIIEGNDVKFTPGGGRKNPNGEFVTINTSNILFILGGAFDGLEGIITSRQQSGSSMGFLGEVVTPSENRSFDVVKQVDTEDLISYGMMPELIGRIPVILPFEDLDQSALTRILTEPKNAITRQFQALFQLEGIKLEFEGDALEAIAGQVMQTRTGARGLRRVIEKLLINSQYAVHQLRRDGVHTICVTKQSVMQHTEPTQLVD